MEAIHREALVRNITHLKDTLDVSWIADRLTTDKIITLTEKLAIVDAGTNELQTISLLDTLIHKGPLAYPSFVKHLREKQPRLADILTTWVSENQPEGEPVSCLLPSQKPEACNVTRDSTYQYDKRLALFHQELDPLSGILEWLTERSVLTSREARFIYVKEDDKLEQSQALVKQVTQKGPEACLRFLEGLEVTQPSLAEYLTKCGAGNKRDIFDNLAVVVNEREDTTVSKLGKSLRSTLIPAARVTVPEGAILNLAVNMRVEATPVHPEFVRAKFGNDVSFGPLVAVIPHRRKFHAPLVVKIPLLPSTSTENMRLLCCSSDPEDPKNTTFEDLTDMATVDTARNQIVLASSVSASFWLASSSEPQDLVEMAKELYEEASTHFLTSIMLGCCEASDFYQEVPLQVQASSDFKSVSKRGASNDIKHWTYDERLAFLHQELDPCNELIEWLAELEMLTPKQKTDIQSIEEDKLEKSRALVKHVSQSGVETCIKFLEGLEITQPFLADCLAKCGEGNNRSISDNLAELKNELKNSKVTPGGAVIKSSLIPAVRATLPRDAVIKEIKLRLEVTPVPPELVRARFGSDVSFGPLVAVVPRRRKFHRAYDLELPLPPSSAGKSLRLLCCISVPTSEAVFDDITGAVALTTSGNQAKFDSTVSALFWLAASSEPKDLVGMANELYYEASNHFLTKIMLGCCEAMDFYQEAQPEAHTYTKAVPRETYRKPSPGQDGSQTEDTYHNPSSSRSRGASRKGNKKNCSQS